MGKDNRTDLFYDMEDAIIDELRTAKKEHRNFSYQKIYEIEKSRYQYYLNLGWIKGLFVHDIMLDNGAIIRIGFFEDGRPVIDVIKDGKANHVLTRYSAETKNVKEAFDLIDMLTDGGGVKPGIRMPDAFVQQMKKVAAGQIFTFGKTTFFVSAVKNGIIVCRKGYINANNLMDYDFTKNPDFEIDTNNPQSLLEFFREHKRLYRGAGEMRITSESYAQKILESFTKDMTFGDVKVINIGSNKICAQSSEDESTHRRKLVYFDEKGKVIPLETMLCMIGWAESSSLSIKRIVRKATSKSRVLNAEFKNRVQQKIAEGLKKKKEFEWLLEEIRRELEEIDTPITVEIKGMQRNDHGYDSKTLVFEKNGMGLKITTPVYDKEGNIKEINDISPVMAKIFIEQKFRENYAYFGEKLSSGLEIDSRDSIEHVVIENTFNMEPKRDLEALAETYRQMQVSEKERLIIEGKPQPVRKSEKKEVQTPSEEPVKPEETVYVARRPINTEISTPDKIDVVGDHAVAQKDEEFISAASNGTVSISHEKHTQYIPLQKEAKEKSLDERIAEARSEFVKTHSQNERPLKCEIDEEFGERVRE